MVLRNSKLMLLTGHTMANKKNKKLTNKVKYLLFFLCLLVIYDCYSSQSLTKIDNSPSKINSSIGWFHGNCFGVRNSNIPKGTSITIVKLDDDQKEIIGSIIRKAKNGEECYPLLDDRRDVNLGNGLSFYIVASDEPINLGIGFIKIESNRYSYIADSLDLNSDGKRDTFSQCSTSEGIQFDIWEGEAYKSLLLWRGYYYLGYDIEPTCP